MAQANYDLTGDDEEFLRFVDERVMNTSSSISREHGMTYRLDNGTSEARMHVVTYERFSMTGGNRVSLHLSVLGLDGRMVVDLTSSGGSQAVLFKINTFGEEAFLGKAVEAVEEWQRRSR
ncbi:DUF6054 family protein [Nocardioides sp.]|uniref:DUF6054 family protein n=1 Tax=Nocardioides sp. TaxID=35761 RepID=UPI0035165715